MAASLSHARLLVWVSSGGTRGGTPPYLAPYFDAKAGMDAMAISYAGELARCLRRIDLADILTAQVG